MTHKKQDHSYPNNPPSFLCPDCGKYTFGSRKDAKLIAKRMKGGLRASAYPCPSRRGWHTGRLAPAVIYGHTTRGELYGRSAA